MSENLQQLVKKYRVFYEVLPYNVVIEEGHGSPNATRRIIQAGFDVDVYGVSDKREPELPPPGEYAFGYAELKKIADAVSQHANECSIEALSFPSTVFSEARENLRSEAMIRIRISHYGADQRVGPLERHALEEVEQQLQGLGMRRR